MLKVYIDESLCTGCGLCESECPVVFKIEGDVAKVVSKDTSSCDVRQTADDCPVSAITVEE
jgi:ferredoxin